MSSSTDEAIVLQQRQLRWQCRRGMKELDFLLVRYLDTHFSAASATDRQNFVRLLTVEDDQLWAWFLGRSQPEDSELNALVQLIRGTA
jgi:antitoxin CptB